MRTGGETELRKLFRENLLTECKNRADKRTRRNPQTQPRRQPQRHGGKRKDAVHRQPEGFFEGVLRRAGGAFAALELDRRLFESAPRPQAAQVTVPLRQRV